jgi:HAD superfamily hydrolase (TIGR01509 family)
MAPLLVIFDCDGVLVDSEPIAARILCEALASHGLNLNHKEADRRFRGRSLTDCILIAEKELGRGLPSEFLPQLNKSTFDAFRHELRAIEGVKGAISEIRNANVPICVASSGSHEKIQLALGLTGLLPFFENNCFSASDVKRGKPAPDLFLLAASTMGVEPAECVIIEDSLPGATAGREAGARVLAYVPRPDEDPKLGPALEKTGAETFGRMDDLPRLLFW